MKNKNKILLFLILTIFLILLGFIASILTGAKDIPIQTVIKSILSKEQGLDFEIIKNSRLPRGIAAFFVGGFLSISGAILQGITRNPLAEPSIMGISQGATLFIAIFNFYNFYGYFNNYIAAFIGSVLSGFLIFIFTINSIRIGNISKFLLAGIALSTFYISLATILAILSNKSQELAFWVSGGFRNVTWQGLNLFLFIGIICSFCSILLSSKINVLNLGDEVAIGLGQSPLKIRFKAIIIVILLCTISVSIAGNIAFVGLIVPYIVTKIFSNDYRIIIPISFTFGGSLLIWADILAKTISKPYEMPIGLFTSIIGVPIFLWIIKKIK